MSDDATAITIPFEIEVEAATWEAFQAVCLGNGVEPNTYLTEACTEGMALILEEVMDTPEDERARIDPADTVRCFESALCAVAEWLSAKDGISLHQAEAKARRLLEAV